MKREIIIRFRSLLEKFNQEVDTISYFPILRDDHVYLYCTYQTKSILYGRFVFTDSSVWNFYEFDYDTDDFRKHVISGNECKLEDILTMGYEKIVRDSENNRRKI